MRLRNPHPRSAAPRRAIEWPTVAVAAAIHAGWLAATAFHASLPLPLLVVVGGWLIAWHGSLQHETIHGHPTRWRRVNDAIGALPLALWLPYAVYRRTHVAHHASAAITDPLHDPESRYARATSRIAIALTAVQAPLLGRLLLGPPIAVTGFLLGEVARLRRAPRALAREWLPHVAALVPVLLWLDWCGLGLGRYVLAFVYPGIALSLLRSFAEHRADMTTAGRAASVERAGPLGLLYLNNQLHAAHHAHPDLAWYLLPDYHRRHRARLTDGGSTRYRSYGEIARRFALRPQHVVIHPAHREPAS